MEQAAHTEDAGEGQRQGERGDHHPQEDGSPEHHPVYLRVGGPQNEQREFHHRTDDVR